MLKKVFGFLVLLLTSFILIACTGGGSTDLVISKVYGPTSDGDNAIELYNNSSKDINLKNYTLDFYTNGSKEITRTIALSGTIEAGGYFIIVGNDFSKRALLDAEVNFTFEEGNLPYNGNDAIQLSFKKKALDVVGFIGFDLEFSRNITLIRLGEKESFEANTEYYRFNFIAYAPDMFQYLGNDSYEIKTLEHLYAGPRLTQIDIDAPFLNPNNESIGYGGTAKAITYSPGDGDTSTFTTDTAGVGGSFRYYYIDTPEVDGTYVSAEPWGYVASKYNKEYQLNTEAGKEVYVQSIPGYSLTETHGRGIGLVWINGYLSQFLIVAEGLSAPIPTNHDSYDIKLTYKNVPYLTFMHFAEERARQNGWGIHGFPSNPNGEKSPDWNYSVNKNSTQNPVWQPHLPMPWN